MIILSVESSCDDTSIAITKGRQVLSLKTASQIEEHKLYGGVVPEIASRRHLESIYSLLELAIKEAKIDIKDINAVAVTNRPGLIGALLVGVNFAKGLAAKLEVPLIPVHHLRAHIAAAYISNEQLKPPFLCLLVSGGNTVIAEVTDYNRYNIIGATRDDAAGECFDKAARAMGLDYPGGVLLDKIATVPSFSDYPLPIPQIDGNELDFSFSGLKTAVINLLHNSAQKGTEVDIPVLAATLRKRVCDILINHLLKAAEKTGHKRLVLAGGVSANSELRREFLKLEEKGFEVYLPELKYCGDNAAMVGVAASFEEKRAGLELNAYATMEIDS